MGAASAICSLRLRASMERKSAIPESKDNVVRRAALRCAARHLRPLGYRYSASDAHLTTSVGHLWSAEVVPGHLRWDNPNYCGVPED